MRLDIIKDEKQQMKIQFGKHKGKEIHKIPKSYLRWLKENIVPIDNEMSQAIEDGLDGKQYNPPTREQRIDQAKQDVLARMRTRETGRTLFRVEC